MCSPVAGVSPVYAILDLETTGFERKTDRIIQIGVVKVDRDVVTPWMAYVNPCKPREEQMEAYQVHRISPDVLQDKQTFADVATSLCSFLENVQYIACHNCIFDWSFLIAEFDRLQDTSDEYKALMKKIKWVDLYRLAIKSFPGSYNFRLRTLLNMLSIQTKKTQNFRYQSIYSSRDQQCCEEFSLFEQGDIKWQEGIHDAMCDSLSTHSLLKKLLEKNSCSNIAELVDKFPQCCIDTELFLALDMKLKEAKTSDEELKPFAAQAEKFYGTMPSLRGKPLGEISKDQIEAALFSGYQRDERICLIYRAAMLNKVDDSQKREAASPAESNISPKEPKTE
ncbi:uncharacterized protein LOC144654522 [Oculina patagonica]